LTRTINALHVKDSDSDSILSRLLGAAGYIVHDQRVDDEEGLRSALAKAAWDVVIVDYRLPRFSAAQALAILLESRKEIPFVVVSGAVVGHDVAVTMIQNELQHDLLVRQSVLLREKDALLREIHHRVKNNLQIVSSLLSLQSRGESDGRALGVLESTGNRIQSMALLHELVYESEDLGVVDLAKYVRQIAERLVGNSESVLLVAELEPVPVNLDTALPCGILVNEVVQNSLLHAFPDERTGEVTVRIRQHPAGSVTLTLSDNGVGLPYGMDWATSQTLGFRLMRALARQLSAELEIRPARGTEVRLRFPVPTDRSST
jgi:two-component sensor histidine kinase